MITKDFTIATAVLEDDSEEREIIDELFRQYPEVEPFFLFGTSSDLFAAMRENKDIKVVVLDYKLSEGKNGLDVMKDIRADDPNEDIYLIIMTAHVTAELLLEFINVRPNYFIRKGNGYEHFEELRRAATVGAEKTCRRLRRELARENGIRELLDKANEIKTHLKTYENDSGSDSSDV